MTQAAATTRAPLPDTPPLLIGEAFTLGWAAFKDRYGILLGAGVIYLLITAGAGSVIGPFAKVFLAPIYVGIGWVGVMAARGQNPQLADLFAPFRAYWPLVAVHSLVLVAMLACAVPGLLGVGAAIAIPAAMDGPPLLAWAVSTPLVVASLVAMLFVAGRLNMAGFIYLETPPGERTIMGSLEEAWDLTAPSRWTLAGVVMLVILVSISSALLLGIGAVFIGMPLAVAVYGAAYTLIAEARPAPTPACERCGYNLTGLPAGLCPECGSPTA